MRYAKKDLLSMNDLSAADIRDFVNLAITLKKKGANGAPLKGKSLAMIFAKSSTRTRVSFEVGVRQLGGQPLFLSADDIQIGRGEPIADTAKVLERYVDAIMIRTFKHSDVEELAEAARIPVINGLTDDEHPCQILADLQTIYEQKKTFNVKIAFIGDGNNIAASLAIACNTLGVECVIASPNGYELPLRIRKKTPSVLYTHNPKEAAKNADVIYTDVWTSMGQEKERQLRRKAFKGFQVNDELAALCKKEYLFLHCLPAHRGEEVTASVIDGPHSAVFDEAENRLHAQKAVMLALMGNRKRNRL